MFEIAACVNCRELYTYETVTDVAAGGGGGSLCKSPAAKGLDGTARATAAENFFLKKSRLSRSGERTGGEARKITICFGGKREGGGPG